MVKLRTGRTVIHKICQQCGRPFDCDTSTQKQVYCSRSCGLRYRGKKRTVDVDLLRQLVFENIDVWRIADRLGVSYYILRRVMTENGIRYKKDHKMRADGYWSYRSAKNHRRIMEENLGRKLESFERVHHIDGDKENNSIDNLCLLSSEKEHAKLHKQLESISLSLLKCGIVRFDKITKTYYVESKGVKKCQKM